MSPALSAIFAVFLNSRNNFRSCIVKNLLLSLFARVECSYLLRYYFALLLLFVRGLHVDPIVTHVVEDRILKLQICRPVSSSLIFSSSSFPRA